MESGPLQNPLRCESRPLLSLNHLHVAVIGVEILTVEICTYLELMSHNSKLLCCEIAAQKAPYFVCV